MTRQSLHGPSFMAWLHATWICSVTKPVKALKGQAQAKRLAGASEFRLSCWGCVGVLMEAEH